MNKIRVGLIAVPVTTVLILAGYSLRNPPVNPLVAVQRDFVQTVVANGRVEAPHRLEIATQLSGLVKTVPVSEGQTVQAGQLLFELDDAEWQANLHQAEASLIQAQTKFRQIREVSATVAQQNLRQAQAVLAQAEASLKRNQDLLRQQFIGQAVLDEASKAREVAKAQVLSQEKQALALQAGGSDYALAEAAVLAAEASVEGARAKLRQTRVYAPVSGVLISHNIEVGNVVQTGKTLMSLSPSGKSQLVVDIDEKNLRWIKPGLSALASTEAEPERQFKARVAWLDTAVNPQTGSLQVKLDVLPDEAKPASASLSAEPGLRQDMTVSVDIEVATKARALLLPLAAIYQEPGRPAYALRLEQQGPVWRVRKAPLQLGLSGGAWVEVLSGAQLGQRFAPANLKLRPGAFVRLAATQASS